MKALFRHKTRYFHLIGILILTFLCSWLVLYFLLVLLDALNPDWLGMKMWPLVLLASTVIVIAISILNRFRKIFFKKEEYSNSKSFLIVQIIMGAFLFLLLALNGRMGVMGVLAPDRRISPEQQKSEELMNKIYDKQDGKIDTAAARRAFEYIHDSTVFFRNGEQWKSRDADSVKDWKIE